MKIIIESSFFFSDHDEMVTQTSIYDISVRKKHFNKLAKSILEDREKDLSFIPTVLDGILNEGVCSMQTSWK